jgi:hypothetical protein
VCQRIHFGLGGIGSDKLPVALPKFRRNARAFIRPAFTAWGVSRIWKWFSLSMIKESLLKR